MGKNEVGIPEKTIAAGDEKYPYRFSDCERPVVH